MYRRPSRPGRRATVDRTERPFDGSLRFAASCLPANQRMEPPEPDVFPSARSLGRRLIRTLALTVKSIITVGVVSLLLTACQHVEPEPERRSTEAEIRQHIEGQWTESKNSDGGFATSQVVIASDGRFWCVHPDGARDLYGKWKFGQRCVVVETVRTNYAIFENGETLSLGTVQYYPVIFADEHELVMTPGISVAGRLR